ncbi:hypothetical protein BGZ59_009347 [Podila verticillata]|nr:hypothetical protein BGZ59_009347 [Podila verticillata]
MNALDIPEIRASVGLHLDNADLISCVRVCRAWQASFEPYIWSDLLISSEESSSHHRPYLKGLLRNAHLVTQLTLAGCSPLEYLVHRSAEPDEEQPPEPVPGSIQPRPPPLLPSPHSRAPQQRPYGFCNLFTLVVSNNRNDSPPHGYWEAIATILSQNPRLNQLKISSIHPPPPLLWRAICSLKPLQALYLYRLAIPPEHARLLWDACSNAISVRFIHTSLSPLPQDPSQQQLQKKTFPHLQRLFILEEQGLSSSALVDLISQCPNLCELQWNTNVGVEFPTELFLERLQTQPTLWPQLRQLRIPHEALVEEQLCKILDATTDLESFSALVLQTVLSSCPSLVSISGEVIRGVEIAMGAPWVCLGLQNFYLDVDVAPHAVGSSVEKRDSSGSHSGATVDSAAPSPLSTSTPSLSPTLSQSEIQKRVLHQLARLQQLQNLTLMSHYYSPSFSPVSKNHRRGLELDLRHGLDLLSGMTQLCNVYFSTIQNMDLEDASWIAQHWKRLSSLTNRLHPDPILNHGLWEVCLRRRKDVVRLGLGLGMGGSIEP